MLRSTKDHYSGVAAIRNANKKWRGSGTEFLISFLRNGGVEWQKCEFATRLQKLKKAQNCFPEVSWEHFLARGKEMLQNGFPNASWEHFLARGQEILQNRFPETPWEHFLARKCFKMASQILPGSNSWLEARKCFKMASQRFLGAFLGSRPGNSSK